jgi:hypothetical protein
MTVHSKYLLEKRKKKKNATQMSSSPQNHPCNCHVLRVLSVAITMRLLTLEHHNASDKSKYHP